MAKRKALSKPKQNTTDQTFTKVILHLERNKKKYTNKRFDQIKDGVSEGIGDHYFSDAKLRTALKDLEIAFKPRKLGPAKGKGSYTQSAPLIAEAMLRLVEEMSLMIGLGSKGPGTVNSPAGKALLLISQKRPAQAARELAKAVSPKEYVDSYNAMQAAESLARLEDDADSEEEEEDSVPDELSEIQFKPPGGPLSGKMKR